MHRRPSSGSSHPAPAPAPAPALGPTSFDSGSAKVPQNRMERVLVSCAMEARLMPAPLAPAGSANSPLSELHGHDGATKNGRRAPLFPGNVALPAARPLRITPGKSSSARRYARLAGGQGRNAAGSRKAVANDVEQVRRGAEQPERGEAPVRGVLFDMDGVLCNSESPSRDAAVALFAELGIAVTAEDFVPFMGTGEANFLGGVAGVYGMKQFDAKAAKKRFFEIYIEKYAQPNSGLGYPGALDLVLKCKDAGLKVAVASSADVVKVNANLAASGLPRQNFDAVVSADLFQNLKPAPDIFLAAAGVLGLPPEECVVVEDALSGVQAARAAGMRCVAVTTTLAEEKLNSARPSLIRPDISKISLEDLLHLRDPPPGQKLSSKSDNQLDARKDVEFPSVVDRFGEFLLTARQEAALDTELVIPLGFMKTRRDVLKLGSLMFGISSLWVFASRWKAMSYVSPKALINGIFGVSQPVPEVADAELTTSQRVQEFVKYIAEIEANGGGQHVEDFKPRLDWLNAPPLSLQRDLKGKIVLLDFWTYCCINCMHILPDLSYLENKYKDQPFTVVGVHSAKFDNEKDSDAIRNAVLRYDVNHPVVNDGEMVMWRDVGVSSWPTVALVSPTGKLLATLAGEGHRKNLDDLVQAALQYYGEKQLLNNRPIPQALERMKDSRQVASPLKFPGKLATDLANRRLFISDSNNHRIVVTDLEGNFILQVGGGGGEGFRDGTFDFAAFNRPQGLSYNPSKNALYVADTENHAVREIDFVKESVKTLAGNGEKGADYKGGQRGQLQVLNSPWDVCLDSNYGVLYVAMAGQHQIWQINLSDGVAKVFSGDGSERNLNGARGSDTSFAQPSGISLAPDVKEMFVADSESSSVRSVNLRTGGSKLLAGGDPLFADNLFKFGDVDGMGSNASLQHPLGVLSGGGDLVYVADSYNHKVKVMSGRGLQVTTVAGTGRAGFKDGNGQDAQLSEPAGLAEGPNGTVYVADTNNSLIRVLDIRAKAGPTLTTLSLQGVQPPPPALATAPRRLRRRISSDTEVVRLDPISSSSGDFQLEIGLPSDYHFTTEAQSKYEADVEQGSGISIEPASGNIDSDGRAKFHFSSSSDGSTASSIRISCKVYYCEIDEVCLYKALSFEIPFSSALKKSSQLIKIPYVVPRKTPPNNSPGFESSGYRM